MAEEKTEWVPIGNDEPLSPGDTVKLYFTVIGPVFIQAAQIAAAEKELEKDKRFRVLSHNLPEGSGWISEMWWKIEVNPMFGGGGGGEFGGTGGGGEWFASSLAVTATLTAAVIAVAIAGAFGFVWLAFREARKFISEGGGPEKVAWGVAKIAAAAVVGLVAIKWFLGKTI